jgi:hypothetical protein
MAKIINTGKPVTVDATPAGHATQNSVVSASSDKPQPHAGGGGT